MNFKYLISTAALLFGYAPLALAAESDGLGTRVIESFGSWVAFAIITSSLLVAYLVNYRAPKIRVVGTLLAALLCFSMVFWFVGVIGSGILENPKANQTPMDSAKPALLWIQAGIALLAGLLLLMTAYRQSKSAETLKLTPQNQPDHYGMVSRMIHWTTAILFISLIPLGIFTSMIPEDAWFRNQYYVLHKTIGVTIFGLLLFRLFWNKRSTRPELGAALKPTERKWAHRAHIALYVMMIAIPVSGYVMTSFHGFATYFFAWELPPLWGKSEAYIVWGTFHKYILQYLIYIILGAHILGALKHYFIDKHKDALKRMVS
jgi:cytochrome b561